MLSASLSVQVLTVVQSTPLELTRTEAVSPLSNDLALAQNPRSGVDVSFDRSTARCV